MGAKVQIEQVSKILNQTKKLKNEQCHKKELLNSFHLNGHTLGFQIHEL